MTPIPPPAEPSSADITAFFQHAILLAGQAPKHLISDQGPQFTAKSFRQFCKTLNIKQRFGAIGHYGSISVNLAFVASWRSRLERFIRSFKDECVRVISVPLTLDGFRKEIELYGLWYNLHRPHERLKGRTPFSVYTSANTQPCSTPNLSASANPATHSPCGPPQLVIEFIEGRRHLPIISLRHAA